MMNGERRTKAKNVPKVSTSFNIQFQLVLLHSAEKFLFRDLGNINCITHMHNSMQIQCKLYLKSYNKTIHYGCQAR